MTCRTCPEQDGSARGAEFQCGEKELLAEIAASARRTDDGVRFWKAGSPSGVPALFLPGAGWTGAQGLFLADALPEFSWHLLDLPGIAGSVPLACADARGFSQWLHTFCASEGIVRPHLVGHSLGGYLALSAAAQGMPLRSLALIDGGLAPLAVPQSLGMIAYAVPLVVALDRLKAGALVARRPGKPSTEAAESAEEIAARFHLPLSEELRRACEDCSRQGEAWDLDGSVQQRLGLIGVQTRTGAALARVKAPVLAIIALHPRGEKWLHERAAKAISVLSALPHVHVVETQTGHYPFWEDPQGFADALRAFYRDGEDQRR